MRRRASRRIGEAIVYLHAYQALTAVVAFFDRNETLAFPAGPSTPKALVKVYDHKTLGKDKCIGEAEVDVCILTNAPIGEFLTVAVVVSDLAAYPSESGADGCRSAGRADCRQWTAEPEADVQCVGQPRGESRVSQAWESVAILPE